MHFFADKNRVVQNVILSFFLLFKVVLRKQIEKIESGKNGC